MEQSKEPRLELIQLANYVRPEVKEISSKSYVMNGIKNSFYTYIIDRYNGSPTNRAIIDSYGKFIYGKGLFSTSQTQYALQFARVMQILSKKDAKNASQDHALFNEVSLEVIYKNGNLQKIKHVPKNQVLPSKMDEEGNVNSYWFSIDFNDIRKYPPIEIPKWVKGKKNGSYIYIISSYQVGRNYFTDPIYMAGLPYAELEEEIANFSINFIKNNLSLGHIINMNQGEPSSQDVKNKATQAIKRDGTGSSASGSIIINWNDSAETAITIASIPTVDLYQQYDLLAKEAMQKLMISHKVTSPILFGIKDNTGLGNNANEMDEAFDKLMQYVIQPLQETELDAYSEILIDSGINIPLDFLPLRDTSKTPVTTKLSKQEQHSDPLIAEALIELGEEISDEWELIDEIEQKEAPQLTEIALSLASVPSSFPSVRSEQDTSLFKIRYKYSGSTEPERDFCAKMMKADKLYRKEDIDLAETKIVNAGLGLNGADTYSIWLYKGGVNCKHFWTRQIYLKKDNKNISVNDARRMILDLDPKDRPLAKWQQNEPIVAQPAQADNNYFKE